MNKDRLSALHTPQVRLQGDDAARLLAALQRNHEPNASMRDLMTGYDESMDEDPDVGHA